MCMQAQNSGDPEVRAFSLQALAGCEALIHPQCPHFWPSPPSSQEPAKNGKAASASEYLGIPRMWAPAAMETGTCPAHLSAGAVEAVFTALTPVGACARVSTRMSVLAFAKMEVWLLRGGAYSAGDRQMIAPQAQHSTLSRARDEQMLPSQLQYEHHTPASQQIGAAALLSSSAHPSQPGSYSMQLPATPAFGGPEYRARTTRCKCERGAISIRAEAT